ncbi:chemotaxis-specific methylesterase [Halovivax asiaticus JCM 14624]|uniref:Protein-glutamate methylesterase/protein-glutamine glutaminase n=1 Tax=Halovivax asiaticus JCM 14624 TaxID=1227490 RepID=M0BT99_9EURY|nr:chemotaxis-specific protein-glutamate methyltransferase CheB [Halovivax asiaticus]ELZ13608.1 chemotaxis-specific methylesterase [Halovivax asiaticus JCM 14624]
MTRVLVVDDSPFIRTVLGEELDEAGYEVETAADGSSAVDAVAECEPDVVTMDVEMPGIGGIEATERIMAATPTPILMLSVHTDDGADASMEALNRGAMAIMEKPDGSGDRTISDLTDELIGTVDELSAASTSALALAQTTAAAHRSRTRTRTLASGTSDGGTDVSTSGSAAGPDASPAPPAVGGRSDVIGAWPDVPIDVPQVPDEPPTIVIGASTGGPRIVEGILGALPEALGARIVVVQHMPAGFTERFAARLDRKSEYAVREAGMADRIGAGEAVVAPGSAHIEVASVSTDAVEIERSTAPRVHGVRPSIDVTMESIAEMRPPNLVGVVCSGMGRDGAHGIEAIHEAGGHTLAQDEATSPVFGIPKQAIETGAVDETVPATSLPARIVANAIAATAVNRGDQ